MQATKKRYWPRGMPSTDIIQSVSSERGSSISMTKRNCNGRNNIFICAYKDRKTKALVSSCSTTGPSSKKHTFKGTNGQTTEITRPQVFEDYETHKSKIHF